MRSLEFFIEDMVTEKTTSTVFNQYRDTTGHDAPGANIMRLDLLKQYIHDKSQSRFLLVGLAPGYAGARFSGLAFVDELHIKAWYGKRLSARVEPWAEQSATIVLSTLREFDIQDEVAMWNAFPYHPHLEGKPLTNRTPTSHEIDTIGHPRLTGFTRLIRPRIVIPVGRVAEGLVRDLDLPSSVIKAPYVRHPAHNGEQAFRNGLWSIVQANTKS